jgi:hypothetical protein
MKRRQFMMVVGAGGMTMGLSACDTMPTIQIRVVQQSFCISFAASILNSRGYFLRTLPMEHLHASTLQGKPGIRQIDVS